MQFSSVAMAAAMAAMMAAMMAAATKDQGLLMQPRDENERYDR